LKKGEKAMKKVTCANLTVVVHHATGGRCCRGR